MYKRKLRIHFADVLVRVCVCMRVCIRLFDCAFLRVWGLMCVRLCSLCVNKCVCVCVYIRLSECACLRVWSGAAIGVCVGVFVLVCVCV